MTCTRPAKVILGIITAIALLSPLPAAAQIPGLGVKAGINLASQRSGKDGEDAGLKSLRGFVAGVFATLPVTSWLELQPEALYVAKGSSFEESGIRADVLLDYLEVPVLARFSMGGGGGVAYYVAGGPFAAFRLRARTRAKFDTATEIIDIDEQVERLDYGLAAGGGVEFGSLVVDGRYTHGLKDVDKDASDRVKVTNRSVSITLGFRF